MTFELFVAFFAGTGAGVGLSAVAVYFVSIKDGGGVSLPW